MRDEEVHQYLLQLIQTLKNEPYYDNLLTRFLLSRALKSQRIGFELFWNLKSEMKNPRYKLRYSINFKQSIFVINKNYNLIKIRTYTGSVLHWNRK
jgi:hypothetical protein